MNDPSLLIVTALKADSAVAAIAGTRIYRATLPKSYKLTDGPAIVVMRVSKAPPILTSSSQHIDARIQCTVFETSDTRAELLSDLVAVALCGDGGVNTGIGNTVVNDILVEFINDAGSVPDNSDGLSLGEYRDNHDFIVGYRNH